MQDKRDILRAARLERALDRRGLAVRQQVRGPVPSRRTPITGIPVAAAAAVAAAAPLAGTSISRGAMSVRKNWYSVAV